MTDLDIDTDTLDAAATVLQRAVALGRVLAMHAHRGDARLVLEPPVGDAVQVFLTRWRDSLEDLAASGQALVDLLQQSSTQMADQDRQLRGATGR